MRCGGFNNTGEGEEALHGDFRSPLMVGKFAVGAFGFENLALRMHEAVAAGAGHDDDVVEIQLVAAA
jgi:hypothetical protein